MPPKRQRPTFGGNLLSVPPPLPDEAVEIADGPADAVAASPPASGPTPEPPAAAGGRDKPPSTLRLNREAGGRLWAAYVAAKQADPFLTYVQFASRVVLQGLAPPSD